MRVGPSDVLRGCYEEVTRKLLPWNIGLAAPRTMVYDTHTAAPSSSLLPEEAGLGNRTEVVVWLL